MERIKSEIVITTTQCKKTNLFFQMGLPSCSHSPHLFMTRVQKLKNEQNPDKEADGAEDKNQMTFHMHFMRKENKIAIDFFSKMAGKSAAYQHRYVSVKQAFNPTGGGKSLSGRAH